MMPDRAFEDECSIETAGIWSSLHT